jgi:ferredoxin
MAAVVRNLIFLWILEVASFSIPSQVNPWVTRCKSSSNCKTSLRRYYQHATTIRASSSNEVPDDPRTEPRRIYTISVPLPLGLTLEEMGASGGVVIVGISPEGNTARLNLDVFSNISQYATIQDKCICIRDKIMSVNGIPCQSKSLEEVIVLITNSGSTEATMELGRIDGSTVLHYSKGRCIAAKPGECYGFLAAKCGVDVAYECRTGHCLTCSMQMEFPDKSNSEKNGNIYRRDILNCVGTVPRNYEWLSIFDEGVST